MFLPAYLHICTVNHHANSELHRVTRHTCLVLSTNNLVFNQMTADSFHPHIHAIDDHSLLAVASDIHIMCFSLGAPGRMVQISLASAPRRVPKKQIAHLPRGETKDTI